MNDFITTDVNLVNAEIALKLYRAYTFCCLFIRLIILALFRLRGRRRNGLKRGGGGGGFMQA